MPVFALYNFDDVGTTALDSALGNGAQNGIYINGAAASGGQAVLDGENDLIKIYQDPTFQMDRGTLDIAFTLGNDPLTGPQTVLSRDSLGQTNGGYRIEILANGAVVISHETPTGTETFGTAPGFAAPGDSIDLSYSWDQGGAGGQLVINNSTSGGTFSDAVPGTLTMDQGGAGINQPWIIGAGQAGSTPELLNNIDQHFQGSVATFQLSDTVDNTTGPDANPDVAVTDEDTPVTVPVLNNDTDGNGQPLTVTTATAPNGTVVINPNGTVTYTPAEDFNGEDTITYTVTDPDGNTATSTVTVTVNPVNDAPDAVNDASVTALNTPVTFAVLGNDTDVDGDVLAIQGAPTSPNGTVVVNANGTLTFTPTPGFTGAAVVNYTVVDPEGLTDTATWTITVEDGANSPPVANDDSASTVQNTPVIIAVLGNDSDPDGDVISIVGTPTSADGTVVVNGDGTITFTPTPGFTGDATINYLITDNNGGTDPAVVTVTVTDPGTRDGIVRGTTGDDLIDVNYPNDNDGDFVDRTDALLPGDAPNDDRILAGDGNDTIAAGQGDDSVEGGTGNDLANGGTGNDTLFGQAGNDTLIGQNGDDEIFGGDGRDLVRAGTGNDLIDTSGDPTPLPDKGYPGIYPSDLDANDDRDTVYGGQGDDTIRTGDDADVIGGGFGNDLIDGGFDDDTINGNQGNDTIIGAEGNDDIDAGYGDDLVYGGYAPNVPDAVNIPDDLGDLRPDNGRDNIRGGLGNDTIFGMDDDDTIDGGQDNDVIDGGVDDDLIRGGMGNDVVLGSQGNDTIDGGQGNDTVNGGSGVDSLSGGADRDTFIVGSQANGSGDVVFGGAGGDDFDRLDLTGAGPYRLTGVVTDSDGNGIDGTVEFLDALGNVTGSMVFTNIEEVIPCFTPGTLIATPKGEVPVEQLKAGDRIITRDNGIQEIRWTGQKALGWKDLAANPHLKPVLIRQGSLGNGLPERDMMVSPNHRMLVANDRTALYFDEHEVLVSAKHLVAGQGIHTIDSIGTTYIHFMFERHEVVLSNGTWTESFQPGDYTLKGMGNAQRNEIFDLFPELQTEAGLNDYQAARRTLKKHEARLLVK
jgi:Ca2+-binding RTX toxin-like protein